MGRNWLPERKERHTACYNYKLQINKGREKNILKQKVNVSSVNRARNYISPEEGKLSIK